MSEQLLSTPCTFGENGNFLLERELGAGGMGGVYMGRDKMLDRPVAVKVMLKEYGADADFVERFKKEAQAAAKLIHPNIAQIYSYGISDGMPYIAMELVAGGSLWTVMQAGQGKADVTRVLKICQQVAQALQCSTDQGFVHGDIKPENILLDANGNAKLVDFGLAGMQKDTSEIWGTPYYIAPEKVRQEGVDFRADMYNLGGTLYHALTNQPPFEGADVSAVVKARFTETPKKPSELRPGLTPAVDALVMRMLELDKDKRFPSFEALIEEFKTVLTSGLETKPVTNVEEAAAEPGKVSTSMKTVKRPTLRTGRRMTTVRKRPTTMAKFEKPEDPDLDNQADEDEEESGGGNLGMKVVGAIVGGILLIGAVIGGLVWFKIAAANAEAKSVQAQIVAGIEKARAAIASNREQALKFADEFDEFSSKAVTACKNTTAELRKLLPDWAAEMQPPPSAELLAAIASTNDAAATAAPAATSHTKWINLDDAHHIGGAKVSAADLAGKLVVVFRWNAKDEACRALLKDVQSYWNIFRSRPVVILGSHGAKFASRDEAAKALAEPKVEFPVYEDFHPEYGEPGDADGKAACFYVVSESGAVLKAGPSWQAVEAQIASAVPRLMLNGQSPAASAAPMPPAAPKAMGDMVKIMEAAMKDAASQSVAVLASVAKQVGMEPPPKDFDPMSPDAQDYIKQLDAAVQKAQKEGNQVKVAPPEGEPAAAEQPKQRPAVLDDMKELWDRAYSCQASAIKIRHQVSKLVKECDSADEIKGDDKATADRLGALSHTTTDALGEIRASKDVENVRKGITYIKQKGEKTVDKTVKRLRIEKLEADRKAAKEKEAAEEKARAEAAAAAKQKLIEDESAAAKDKFDALVAQGVFIGLDWESALRQLKSLKDGMKSPEGGFAADHEIRKVESMKKVQDIFKDNMPGYTFKKSKLKGNTVRKADATMIDTVKKDGKTPQKLSWKKFYKEYHGNLNELINTFVVKGRENGKKRLNLREWSDAMCGAALTMRIICGDSPSAAAYGETLVKQVAEAYPDYQKNLKAMFPDIALGGEEAAAAEEQSEEKGQD